MIAAMSSWSFVLHPTTSSAALATITPMKTCHNGSMGKKCKKVEKKARVEELADLRETWGLCDDSANLYIQEARDVVKDDLFDIDRVDMLASKVRILEQIARDSVASGREINLIGAIRLLAESTGFGVNQKR